MRNFFKALIELGIPYFLITSLFDWNIFRHGTAATIVENLLWRFVQSVIFVLLWLLVIPLVISCLSPKRKKRIDDNNIER